MSMIGELMEQVNTLSKSLERKVDVASPGFGEEN